MKCPSCGADVQDRFCSKCGCIVSEQNGVYPASVKPKTSITLTFGKSTSKNYTVAVERAMRYATYSEDINGKDITHRVSFELDQVIELRDMLDLVGSWKSAAIYVDDKLVPFGDIQRLIYCYSERQRAYNPKEYCYGRDDANTYNDNDLGCRQCGINPYEWHGLSGFGEMQADGTFTVDKNRLIFTAARNLEPFMLCPALDLQSIKKKLEAFPTTINPKTNRQWEYVTDYSDERSAIVAVAVRKKDIKKESGYVVKERTDLHIEVPAPAKAARTGGCLIPTLLSALFLSLTILAII